MAEREDLIDAATRAAQVRYAGVLDAFANEWVATERQRTQRNMLAEAFIRGIQVGADDPELAGDGDAMYQAFRDWIDSGE